MTPSVEGDLQLPIGHDFNLSACLDKLAVKLLWLGSLESLQPLGQPTITAVGKGAVAPVT